MRAGTIFVGRSHRACIVGVLWAAPCLHRDRARDVRRVRVRHGRDAGGCQPRRRRHPVVSAAPRCDAASAGTGVVPAAARASRGPAVARLGTIGAPPRASTSDWRRRSVVERRSQRRQQRSHAWASAAAWRPAGCCPRSGQLRGRPAVVPGPLVWVLPGTFAGVLVAAGGVGLFGVGSQSGCGCGYVIFLVSFIVWVRTGGLVERGSRALTSCSTFMLCPEPVDWGGWRSGEVRGWSLWTVRGWDVWLAIAEICRRGMVPTHTALGVGYHSASHRRRCPCFSGRCMHAICR